MTNEERNKEAQRFWELSRASGTELLKHGLTLAVGILAALYTALTSTHFPSGASLDRKAVSQAVWGMGLAIGGGLLAWAADVGLHASWAYRIYNGGVASEPIFPHPFWRWLRIVGVVLFVVCFLYGIYASAKFVHSAI
jgi:hypothetical protein